eukprot:14586006-Ditylum_brightwellii.AAC.1
MGVYTDMLNISMKNSPQDGTISNAIVLKPWTMNNLLVQKPFNSTLGDDRTPGVMVVQNPMKMHNVSKTTRWISHYLSNVQKIQFYQEPSV